MQFRNQYNLHGHNVASVANSDDGSSLSQETLSNHSQRRISCIRGDAAGLRHERFRQCAPRIRGGAA